MNKKHLFLVIALFTFSNSLFSQEESSTKESYFTLNTVPTIAYFAPRFELGYVKTINERWKIGLDVGYGNKNLVINYIRDNERIGEEYQLFEIRPQLYFQLNKSRRNKLYISSELSYILHKDRFLNNEIYINGSQLDLLLYDSADYKREKLSVNFNFGMFTALWKRFGINPSIGIGVRNRKVSYSNIVNPMLAFDDVDDGLFTTNNYLKNQGTSLGVNFSVGLKVYFMLDK